VYKLIILEEADKELTESAKWYETKREGLGERFVDAVKNKLQIVQQSPERYPKRKGNFRETVVKVFPFIIVYTFYKKEKNITINSIFHASRNPRKKYRRK